MLCCFFFPPATKPSSFCKDHLKENWFPSFWHHYTIPWYFVQTSQPSDFKPHPIIENSPYRLWNIVSNGLIQRSPADPAVVTCMGGFNSDNSKFELHFKWAYNLEGVTVAEKTVWLYKSLLGLLPYVGFSGMCVTKGYQWFFRRYGLK